MPYQRGRSFQAAWTDADGKRRYAACPTREAAEALEAKRKAETWAIRNGLADRASVARMVHVTRSMEQHIQDFADSLSAARRTPGHIQATRRYLEKFLASAAIGGIVDLDAARLTSYAMRFRAAGASDRTCAGMMTACKSFAKWLHEAGRLATNPFSTVHIPAIRNRVRVRRALSDTEVLTLLRTTADADTRMIYRVALYTGLREGECLSLMPESFDLTNRSVSLPAESTKNRQAACLPLCESLVAALYAWLPTKPPRERLWQMSPYHVRARLKKDLSAAGIAVKMDDGVIDFHALRGTYCTMLARGNTHPKVAQALMRHSDVNLTMRFYTHMTRHDEQAAVDGLPTEPKEQEGKVAG